MSLRPGVIITVKELDGGRFSVWSPADEGPGAYFLVPVDDDSPYKYVVIRATQHSYQAWPDIEVLHAEAKGMP